MFCILFTSSLEIPSLNNCSFNLNFNPNKVKNKINIWIISELEITIKKVNVSLNNYRFNDAADAIYKFLWNTYCDWYIEFLKPNFLNKIDYQEFQSTSTWVLFHANQLLNPFMPYVTETLNRNFFKQENLQITSDWPKIETNHNLEIKNQINFIIKLITKVRSIKSELGIPNNTKLNLYHRNCNDIQHKCLNEFNETITSLAKLNFCKNVNENLPNGCAVAIIDGMNILVPVKDFVDINEEIMFQNKLNNESFLKKAPDKIVGEMKIKLKLSEDKKLEIENSIKILR